MATYMIGYDLNREGQDYETLIDAIKKIGAWWHHLDSTWIVETNATAAQIRDRLRPLIDENDELLVARISAPAAWAGFNERGSKWLREHVS